MDGIVSTDSDCLVFGANLVVKNLFALGGRETASGAADPTKWVEYYESGHITRTLNLNQNSLVAFSVLVGCDYTEGVKNVGLVTAVEVLSVWREVFSSPYLGLRAFYEDLQRISRYFLSRDGQEGKDNKESLLLSKFLAKHSSRKKRQRREEPEELEEALSGVSSEQITFFESHPVYSYVFPQNRDGEEEEEEHPFPSNRVINAFLSPETFDSEDLRALGQAEEESAARAVSNLPFLPQDGNTAFSLPELQRICDFCAHLFSLPRTFRVIQEENAFRVEQQDELNEVISVLTKQKTSQKDKRARSSQGGPLQLSMKHFLKEKEQQEQQPDPRFASSRLSDALGVIKRHANEDNSKD